MLTRNDDWADPFLPFQLAGELLSCPNWYYRKYWLIGHTISEYLDSEVRSVLITQRENNLQNIKIQPIWTEWDYKTYLLYPNCSKLDVRMLRSFLDNLTYFHFTKSHIRRRPHVLNWNVNDWKGDRGCVCPRAEAAFGKSAFVRLWLFARSFRQHTMPFGSFQIWCLSRRSWKSRHSMEACVNSIV